MILGSLEFCEGGYVTLQSTSPAWDHQWYKDGVAINGNPSNGLIARATGSYTVQAIMYGCASALSSPTNVLVHAIPPKPVITPGGSITICDGGTKVLSSSAPLGNQWYLNASPITGATGQTYNARMAGNYSVRVEFTSCQSELSATVAATIVVPPPPPTITQSGNTLSSSAASGNQWYKDGVAIEGATQHTYEATLPGLYTVRLSANGCISPSSNAINIVPTAINSPELESKILMYPNPVKNRLMIQYKGNNTFFSVYLLDISGKKVLKKGTFSTNYQLDMEGYTAGNYIVQIINNKTGEQTQRIIFKN